MHSLDSRSRNFGILVLRHEGFDTQPGYNESNPIGILAKNVTGRQVPAAGGRFLDNKRTVGNVMPWLCWPKDTRPAPAHAPIWPAIVGDEQETSEIPTKVTPKIGGGGGVSRSGGTTFSGTQTSGNPYSQFPQPQVEPQKGNTTALPADSVNTMLPVKTSAMQPDIRFAPVGYATPMDPHGRGPLWPIFPKGFYGLALPATDEPKQINLFMPTDPRLFAINNGNEPEMGSMVCDTDDDDEIDPERIARLQSAFRVIKSPYNRTANAIALQLSRAENHDCGGGFVIDHDRGDVIGSLSFIYGGPFDVGDDADSHHLSNDGDGNSINPVHLSLDALFKHRTSRDMDGPLHHEGYFQGAQDFPFSSFVKFEWDPAIGKHRWRAKVPIYIPNTDTPTQTPPPTDRPPPNEPSGGSGVPGSGGAPPGAPGGGDVGKPPQGPAPGGQPPESSGGSNDDGPSEGPVVPWDPEAPDWRDGDKWRAPDDKKKGDGAGKPPVDGGKGGGGKPKGQGDPPGRMPVGPLPGGGGFGGWDPDPFAGWIGWKPGKNGGKKKQAERAARAAAKKARKEGKKKERQEKNKKNKNAVRWIVPPDDTPLVPRSQNEPFKHGFGPKFKGQPQFRMVPPPVPFAFSPDIHAGVPKGGGGGNGTPTPVTSTPTPGVTITPPAQGPRPSGGLPGPQCPPAIVNEIMLPSIILRPQCYSLTAPDLRYDNAPNLIDVVKHDRATPVTGHIQAYGAQGGAVGSDPGLSAPNNWLYTVRPRTGRWWQGSGNGGAWMTPGEVDLADMSTDLDPQNVVQSTNYFGMAPQVYFGVGLPDLAQGGMRTGYRWGADRSGNATFSRMDSSGVATDILELGADGIVSVFPRGVAAGQGAQVNLYEPGGVNSIAFQAPDALADDIVYVMPTTDPTAGQVLSASAPSGGVSTLSWVAASPPTGLSTLYATAVQTATAGTGLPEALATYTVPAATMTGNGDAVIVRAFGKFAVNTNPKSVGLVWDATTVLVSNNITPSPNGGSWSIEAKVMFRSPTVGSATGSLMVGAVPQSCLTTAPSCAFASPLAVTVVAVDNGTAGDIICDGFEVENAPV
jgi:hypothetical protein